MERLRRLFLGSDRKLRFIWRAVIFWTIGGDLKKGAITYAKGRRPLSGGSRPQAARGDWQLCKNPFCSSKLRARSASKHKGRRSS
jgi:hypothetical protein